MIMTDAANTSDGAVERDALGKRIIALAERLAEWSETPDGLTCTYLTSVHRAVAGELRGMMQAAGMSATIDDVGNVVGRYPAADSAARTLIVASHYDTVINAGNYDGRLGILTGIVAVEQLHRSARRLPFHVDVIGFAEEEGVRFSVPYIGSTAIAGRFDRRVLQRRHSSQVPQASDSAPKPKFRLREKAPIGCDVQIVGFLTAYQTYSHGEWKSLILYSL